MKIEQLQVRKNDNIILDNLDVLFQPGKLHVIMGPNGSGKSTLSNTIAGHPDYLITQGSILFDDNNIINQSIEDRALMGIYLAPQYPPVIEGLSHASFLKEAINIRLRHQKKEALDDFQFLKTLRNKAQQYGFDPKIYPKQSFNSGFSGGEKKRNEILQISLLEPQFLILDEIDSGLDIESMKKIAQFLVDYKKDYRTIVVITHYPQFAQLLFPDFVHILKDKKIIHSGGSNTIHTVLKNGFGDFT